MTATRSPKRTGRRGRLAAAGLSLLLTAFLPAGCGTAAAENGAASATASLSAGAETEASRAASADAPAQETPRTEETWQALIDAAVPGIDCWGDSITEGFLGDGENYPATLAAIIDRELIDPIRERSGYAALTAPIVRNMGVSTETTLEIAGRRGAIPFVVSEAFVIPAGRTAVKFSFFSAERGEVTKPLRAGDGSFGGNGVNPVTIGGVTGELIRYYDYEADFSRYQFQRDQAGEAVAVSAGEPVVTDAAEKYSDDLCVVLMGANGGYDGVDGLVAQFAQMAAMQDDDRYLLIGMGHSAQNDGLLADEEARALADAFGDRFLNLQAWMSKNGIDRANRYFDASIVPTETDVARIARGETPASLLNEDNLHYTPMGYQVIGRMVFEEMDRLGYFDGLRALAEVTE